MAEKSLCAVDGCDKHVSRRCYCNAHYLKWRRHGDPYYEKPPKRRGVAICEISGCDKKVKTKNLCNSHYLRLWRHGSPLLGGAFRLGDPLGWLEENKDYSGDQCLEWPFSAGDQGRGVVRINGRSVSAPRAICILAHGEPPSDDHQAAHYCGNGHLGCVNPKHLRWATRSENEADKVIHGTLRRGVRINTNVLSEAQVREIRLRIKTERGRDLAVEFGVSPSAISGIKLGHSWAWLEN